MIQFFHDRHPVKDLATSFPEVLSSLRTLGVPVHKDSIHFCGMVSLPEMSSAVFLPHGCRSNDNNDLKRLAALTMQSISKYGTASKRSGHTHGPSGSPQLPAIIQALCDDLVDHGLHTVRAYNQPSRSGRVDWQKTFRRSPYTLLDDGNIWFQRYEYKATVDTCNSPISFIHAEIMREICDQHDWWIPQTVVHLIDELPHIQMYVDRQEWDSALENYVSTITSEPVLERLDLIRSYIELTSISNDKGHLCGIVDFSTLWEAMLDQVLADNNNALKQSLPRPTWHRDDGTSLTTKGLRPDTILTRTDHHVIIDAKYYLATSAETLPPLSDITKQNAYRDALVQIVPPKNTITNHFVFPSRNGAGPFTKLDFPVESDISSLPTITCTYLSTEAVMAAWISNEFIRIEG